MHWKSRTRNIDLPILSQKNFSRSVRRLFGYFTVLYQLLRFYGLDDRDSRVRFPAEAGNLSLHHRAQTASGAHPASYPMGIRGSFPGGKAAGA
jgi:hypothetical protein